MMTEDREGIVLPFRYHARGMKFPQTRDFGTIYW